jgi:putative aldouronate transport system substrate-binding protein
VKFLDHTFTPEGQTVMHYGLKGTSYDEQGAKKSYKVKFEDQGNKPLGTPVWNFLQDRLTFPAPVDNDAYYDWMDELTKSFAKDYFTKYTEAKPILKYTPEQLKERTELEAAVKPFVEAETVKFVMGKRDLAEWDAFLAEAEQKGAKKITAIDQAALDAMPK